MLILLLFFAAPGTADDYLPGRIIIKFDPGYEPHDAANNLSGIPEVDSMLITSGLKKRLAPFAKLRKPDSRGLSRVFEFRLEDEADIKSLAERISKTGGIEYAEPVFIRRLSLGGKSPKSGARFLDGIPNDPYYSLQWALPNVSAPAAWDVTTGSQDIVIAVVDNGVGINHPDLAARIWTNPGEIADNGIDDDNNGYIDDDHGWDFPQYDNDPNPTLGAGDEFHGTHVSGIAAAAMNNSRGVAGIAPDCRIMPVKTGEGGLITYGYLGIVYAYENGAKVINLSWGGYASSALEEDAIANACELGVLVVAAAGNENTDEIHYPSAYSGVIAVTSTSPDNSKSGFSNYGTWVDVCAPGDYIYSTIVDENGNPGYALAPGTSMSSPLVAGIGALVFAINPSWSNQQVTTKIFNTCDDIYDVNPAYTGLLGTGKVNAYQAVGDLLPGLRFYSFAFSDTAFGDGDGIPEPGESLEIVVTLENTFQDAENVLGELSTQNIHATVIQNSASFGDIPAGTFADNEAEPFLVELGSVQEGEKIVFTLELNTNSGFGFNMNFNITALPPYATHNAGNVVCTVTNFGAIGYQDYPYTGQQPVGEGFRYPATGINALYHGSMALGLNTNRVGASIYRENIYPYAFEWHYDNYILFLEPGDIADQETHSVYYDHNVFTGQPGAIEVEQTTYAWADEPVDDFIIIEYKYINSSSSILSELYAGIFMDWDIDNYSNNSVGYISGEKAGYMFAGGSACYGLVVLSDEVAAHRAINNAVWTYGTGLTDSLLYVMMKGDFGLPTASGGDFSHLLSVGPFSFPPGGFKKVAFGIVAGSDYDDFVNNVHAADSLYATLASTIQAGPVENPLIISLSPPNPNPFNRTMSFNLNLTKNGYIDLKVYDILGRETANIFNGYVSAGTRRFNWEVGGIASGTYFLLARAGDKQDVRKLILVK